MENEVEFKILQLGEFRNGSAFFPYTYETMSVKKQAGIENCDFSLKCLVCLS